MSLYSMKGTADLGNNPNCFILIFCQAKAFYLKLSIPQNTVIFEDSAGAV